MRVAVLFVFAGASASLTEQLRAEVNTTWHAATHHPMTDAFAEGTLPPDALKRYLVQDHKFIDAFASLLAAMISRAPTLTDRIPGAQFLAVITGPENTYFERSFEALGINAAEREASPAAVTARFIQLMRDAAARAEFAEMLGVLVVAEWSYLEWGERVAVTEGVPFWFSEWVDLHRGPAFRSLVGYLRGLLDGQEALLTPSQLANVRANFRLATQLELAFWDMAWSGDDRVPTEEAGAADDDEVASAAKGTPPPPASTPPSDSGRSGRGLRAIERLRAEPFNQATERALLSHPIVRLAQRGKLKPAQRKAFVGEQYAIQLSDAASFAALAGHAAPPFVPRTLTNATVPEKATEGPSCGHGAAATELFQFLLSGEVYAAPLLLAQATSRGDFEDEAALQAYVASTRISSRAQAYPSFWARLALQKDSASGAAACAVNFPAWGRMCGLLRDALIKRGSSNESVGFLSFFASPIDNLDAMASAALDEAWAALTDAQVEDEYPAIATNVRLLQEYELAFWDAVVAAK